MSDKPEQQEGLTPEELAEQEATVLPNREAMSLITGLGVAGPLPYVGHPIDTTAPDTVPDPLPPGPLSVAPDSGTPTSP